MRLLTTLCLYFAMSHADNPLHYYDLKQGLVEYEILGNAKLTEDTNLNIQGRTKLYFTNWGNIRQEKEEGVLVTQGAINDILEVKQFVEYIEDKVFTVDYDNKYIVEYTEDVIVASQEKETKGFLSKGKEVIAGIPCEVWIDANVKKCIYQGVVLKQEAEVFGITYVMQATTTMFDSNITVKKYPLPAFEKKKVKLSKDTIQNTSSLDNRSPVSKNIQHKTDTKSKNSKSNVNMYNLKREKLINKITKDIYRKQQKILPALLVVMKKSRECLSFANGNVEKKKCIKVYDTTKNALGFEHEDYTIFDIKEQSPRDAIEDAIVDLQSRMSCVNNAQNFIDLARCMK